MTVKDIWDKGEFVKSQGKISAYVLECPIERCSW